MLLAHLCRLPTMFDSLTGIISLWVFRKSGWLLPASSKTCSAPTSKQPRRWWSPTTDSTTAWLRCGHTMKRAFTRTNRTRARTWLSLLKHSQNYYRISLVRCEARTYITFLWLFARASTTNQQASKQVSDKSKIIEATEVCAIDRYTCFRFHRYVHLCNRYKSCG